MGITFVTTIGAGGGAAVDVVVDEVVIVAADVIGGVDFARFVVPPSIGDTGDILMSLVAKTDRGVLVSEMAAAAGLTTG